MTDRHLMNTLDRESLTYHEQPRTIEVQKETAYMATKAPGQMVAISEPITCRLHLQPFSN